MKTTIGLALLLAIFAPASAGVPAVLDDENGFRDLPFGAPVDPKRFAFKESNGRETYYSRLSDDLHMGTAELSAISYGFYKNRLFGVVLQGDGLTNCTALREALISAYGPGVPANQSLELYTWNGARVLRSFQYDEDSRNCTAIFACKELAEEKMREQKPKAEKSKPDL